MPTTFAANLDERRGRWIAYLAVEGIGRRIYATTANRQKPYRWATRHPYTFGYTADAADPYHVALDKETLEAVQDRIDFREGKTLLGQLGPEIVDVGVRSIGGDPHGWGSYLWTDLLAIEGPAHSTHSATDGQWVLSATMAIGDGNIALTSVVGIAIGDVLHIEGEAVAVTDIPPGTAAGTVDVTRGVLGTTAKAHGTTDADSEGVLYDRPRFMRGRKVWLYANLFDSTTGLLLPETEAFTVWQGTLDDFDWTDDLLAVQFACKPTLGSLAGKIGRNQVDGKASLSLQDEAAVARCMENQETLELSVSLPSGVGSPQTPSGTGPYFRFGDQIVRVSFAQDANSDEGTWQVTYWGVLGTEKDASLDSQTFREVILSHPDPGDTVPSQPFQYNGAATDHPGDIALCLITSTGAGTNGDWDNLPADWGRGVAVGDVNTQAWLDLIESTALYSFPRFVIGSEGKPIDVKEWVEKEIMGPLGWFFYPDTNGKIAVGAIREAFPKESLPTLTTEDIIVEGAPRPAVMGQLSNTVSWQTFNADFDFASDKPQQIIKFRSVEANARLSDDSSELEFDVHGVSAQSAPAALEARGNIFASLFSSPLPMLRLSVGLHKLELDITTAVSVTCPGLPNPFTGERGLTTQPCAVVGRSVNLSAGYIELMLMMLPTPNVGHWAPSGRVASYVAGAPPVITINANDFSAATGGSSTVPIRDALGFTVGDYLMLLDSDGQVLVDTAPTVAVAPETDGANTIRLSTAFTLAAAPVAPVAGNIITFAHYASGDAPNAAWTANMKDYVAQADDADELLPNGDDPYVYGTQ